MEIQSASEKINKNSPAKTTPGGFLRRFAAVALDSIAITLAVFPVNFIVAIITISIFGKDSLVVVFAGYPFQFLVMYFYYGYFYSQKGASLGKMVLNLKVINTDTGKNLSYKEAFLRETIGKFISGILLFIGYLVVLFREDKKTFHDQIFHTQVLHQEDV